MKSNGYQFWFEADGGKTKLQLPGKSRNIDR